jgi:hypothetical protein
MKSAFPVSKKVTTTLKKMLARFLLQKQFVFVSRYYQESASIDDTNVTQYEFINQGTTIAEVNDIKIYPAISGIEPQRVLLNINSNEKDVEAYKLRFIPLDFQIVTARTAAGTDGKYMVQSPQPPLVPFPNVNFNRLLVISKVQASVRGYE